MSLESVAQWAETSGVWWLLDAAVQATIVLTLAWLVARFLPGLSAAKKHAVLATGLVGIPVLLFMGLLTPGWIWMREVPRLAPAPEPKTPQYESRVFRSAESRADAPTLEQSSSSSGSITPHQAERMATSWWPLMIPALWMAGVGVGLAGMLGAGWKLRQLRRHGATAPPMRLQQVLDELLRQSPELARRVELLCSKEPVMPMTWGWCRIWLILPQSAQEWDEARVRFVLRHELAHVTRGDTRSVPLLFGAALLLWFHPLAWVVLKSAARSREAACDDVVLQEGEEAPSEYADALLVTVVELGNAARPPLWAPALGVAMASRDAKKLQLRLRDILEERGSREPLSRRMGWALTTTGVMILPLLAGLSACREKKSNAEAPTSSATPKPPTPGVVHTYLLTDKQWQNLIAGEGRHGGGGRPVDAVDPFKATATGKPVEGGASPERPKPDLNRYALHIRSLLLEHGVEFAISPGVEPLALRDSRTLVAVADEANQKKIGETLAMYASTRAIDLSGRVFTAPMEEGIMASLGVEVTPAGEGVVRAILSEKEGSDLLKKMVLSKKFDLMAAPLLHTVSGQRGTVEVAREFIYPTKYDPPSVPPMPPPDAAKTDLRNLPVIPTTPTVFEMRPVGVRMEFDPYLEADGSVSLDFFPEVTWLEGLMNYGLPIRTVVPGKDGAMHEMTLSENRIQQPVFFTIKHRGLANLKTGEWLLMGGFGVPEVKGEQSSPTMGKHVEAKELPSVMEPRKMVFFLVQVSVR